MEAKGWGGGGYNQMYYFGSQVDGHITRGSAYN